MDLKGLTKTEVEESRKKHGSNNLTQIPPDPLWKKPHDNDSARCFGSTGCSILFKTSRVV